MRDVLDRPDRVGGDREDAQHDHAGHRAERSERSADEDDDEQLEREVRPVLRRVPDAGELDAERPGQPACRPGDRERRHAQALHRDADRCCRRLAIARRAEAEPERRAGERGEAEPGEGRQGERELVVPGG